MKLGSLLAFLTKESLSIVPSELVYSRKPNIRLQVTDQLEDFFFLTALLFAEFCLHIFVCTWKNESFKIFSD